MAKQAYSVTHEDGRKEVKNSVREFTHAVVANNGTRDSVRAWAGSETLAQKQMAAWSHWFNVRVVPVNKGA